MQSAQDALTAAAQLAEQGDLRQAEAVLARLLASNHGDAEALHQLGCVAVRTNRLNFAVELFRLAIQHRNDDPRFYYSLGVTFGRLGQLEEGLKCYRRAVQICPDFHDACVQAGTTCELLGNLPLARDWMQRAVSINPGCELNHYNLGSVRLALGELDLAIQDFDSAIRLEPDFAKAHWNKALCHLLQGDFSTGWNEYAWRQRAGEVAIDRYPQPRWRGEPLDGKTVLVHAEQGIGDEILFASCLPDVIDHAQRCVVVCDPRLEQLFARSFPLATVRGIARRKDRAPCDAQQLGLPPTSIQLQAPIGDLPRYLRSTLGSFPQRDSYLVADPVQVEHWRECFAELKVSQNSKLCVGISWRAGGQPHERQKRSTMLSQWQELLRVPGVAWIDLQYGETAEELAQFQASTGITVHHFDDGDPLIVLDSFAAKLRALDLVISVGNSTVHLAGALGVPTWAMVPARPGWRWLQSGESIPWYSSVQIVRQNDPENWHEVLARIAARLRGTAVTPRQDELSLQARVTAQAASAVPTASPAASLPPTKERAMWNGNPIVQGRFEVTAMVDAAAKHYAAGELEQAEKLFHDALSHAPRNTTALCCLGRIAMRTNRNEMATRMLRRAAAVDPTPACLYDLACAQLAQRELEAALESFDRVLAIRPEHGEAYFGKANTLRELRRSQLSLEAYRKAARLLPENPKVFNYLGVTLMEQRELSAAEIALRRAVQLAPGYTAAWNNLGCVLSQQNQQQAAVECFDRVLSQEPQSNAARANRAALVQNTLIEFPGEVQQSAMAQLAAARPPAQQLASAKPVQSPAPSQQIAPRPVAGQPVDSALPPEIYNQLIAAAQLFNQEKWSEAADIARKVLKTHPRHAVALRIVGVGQRRAGQLDAAIELLRQAIDSEPANFALWFELGVTYLDRMDQRHAYECFLRSHEIKPEFQPACVNLAGVLEQQERYEEAEQWGRKAVALDGNCPLANYNLANTLREQGRLTEAIAHYQRSLQLNPDYVRADWNLGICHLHLGNYGEGWKRYENRATAEEVSIDRYTQPRWNGEPLAGKTIVVHAEQGIGDEIVFCSCLPELIAMAGRVIVVCEPRLQQLFRRSFPQAIVHGYARRKDWAPFPIAEPVDFQIPMGSLPLHLRPTRDSFPQRERFLIPDAKLVEQWRSLLATLGRGPKIGISWRAGGKPLERRKRSVVLEHWAPILQNVNAHFINLQYGDASNDAAEVRDLFQIELHDWEQGDPLVDMDSYAAKIAALDLVISVGNATVHMAGAVGTPAWTMLPMIPSWRWMVAGDTSPWYTSVRLFRQPQRKQWTPVVQRLGNMLQELSQASATEYRSLASRVTAPPPPVGKTSVPTPLSDEAAWLDSSEFSAAATLESIPDILRQAEQKMAAGEYTAAEQLYRSVLMIAPRYPSALQGLSRAARKQGKIDLAIRSIHRALTTAENVASRRCDLAGALADAGRHDEATESYLRAIELDPQLYLAHYEFGLLLQMLDRHEEAIMRLQHAHQLQPKLAEVLVAQAESMRLLCRMDEAIELLQRARALEPNNAAVLSRLAAILIEDQRRIDAEPVLHAAIELEPQIATHRITLAELLVHTGRLEQAAEQYHSVLREEPNHYQALVHLATLEGELARPAEAERLLRIALANQPDAKELHNSLGQMLSEQGRLSEALASLDTAIRLAGSESYPLARMNRALVRLQAGQFESGWQDYEYRWQANPQSAMPARLAKTWNGENLTGKTLLIHAEQGIGDEIMFATCYQEIIDRAGRVVLTCEPRLAKLFQRSFPKAHVIAVVRGLVNQWQPPAKLRFDYQISAGSLPLYLRKSEGSFLRQERFLMPNPELVAQWQARFAALDSALASGQRASERFPKIGIAWRAGQKLKDRRARSIALRQWLPILAECRAQWINLQSGDCQVELNELAAAAVQVVHLPEMDNRNDLDGLAARMAGLDLVIAAGSSTVHLAAAVGVPTWALLPCHGAWRWGIDRQDSPWYASVRLFRQQRPGDWDEPIMRVRQELLNWQAFTPEGNTMVPLRAPHWNRAATPTRQTL